MITHNKVATSDIVICINSNGDIEIVKDRNDYHGKIDLAELIRRIIPYQKDYLHTLLNSWIDKLKIYRTFS